MRSPTCGTGSPPWCVLLARRDRVRVLLTLPQAEEQRDRPSDTVPLLRRGSRIHLIFRLEELSIVTQRYHAVMEVLSNGVPVVDVASPTERQDAFSNCVQLLNLY